MTDSEAFDTLPLSKPIGDALARDLDKNAVARDIGQADSRCTECGELVRGRQPGFLSLDGKRVRHAVPSQCKVR